MYNRRGIDTIVLRKGKQVSVDDGKELSKPISNVKIIQALKSLGDNKASGVDDYNAKFILKLLGQWLDLR